MYNKRVLSKATSELGKAKAPAKKRDIPVPLEKISRPFVSNEGYKQGPPAPGQHYRIPSDTLYNPTPYRIKAVSDNNIVQYLEPNDTTNKVFPGANYVDEYPAMAQGGNRGTNRALFYRKGGEKKYSRSLEAKNRLFVENPLFKKKKSKKKKIFDPNAKYYQEGGVPIPEDYSQFQSFAQTLPSNLQDPSFEYGNPDQYDLYGMWETVGKPGSFTDVQDSEYFPLDEDGTYHGFTVGSDGTLLKPMSHSTTWKEVMNSQLSTDPYFQENRLIRNEQGRLQYIPKAEYGMPMGGGMSQNYQGRKRFIHQDGGLTSQEETDAANQGMMKARLAYANMHGNPAAQRMVVAPDQPYQYTGDEYDQLWGQPVGAEPGMIGTHYMGSFGNYAVPFIQQGSNGLYFNESPSVRDREAIKFDNEDDAQYFGEHYKEITPDESYRQEEFATGGITMELTDSEIEQYRKDGYVVDELPIAQKGGSQVYTYADRPEAKYKKDTSGNWLISLPSTNGKYVPIKDPTGKRAGELNEKAKPYIPAKAKSNLSSYEDRINKTQVSDNTAVRNYPEKKAPSNISFDEMIKVTPTALATKDYILKDKNLSQDQKEDLLFNRHKANEYIDNVNYARNNEATVKQVSKRKNNPYSRERLWDIATNPFDAFKYSISEGGLESMPYNYNKMKDAGIDPSASSFQERFGYGDEGRGKGSNLVGDFLNKSTNLLDAGDKVVRNINKGDYFGALLEAGRFIGPSELALRTSVNMTKAGIQGGKQLGNLTKKVTTEVGNRVSNAILSKASELNFEAKMMGKEFEKILNMTKPGRQVAAKARDVRTAGLKTIRTTGKATEYGLAKVKAAYNKPLIKSQKTREEGVKWINEHGRVRDTWRPGATRQYNSFEKYITPSKLMSTYTMANAAMRAPEYIAKHQRSLEKIAENPDQAQNYINMGWNMIRYVGDLTALNKTVDAINTPMKVYEYSQKAYEEANPWYGAKAVLSLAGMQRASTRKEGGETDINKRRQVLRDWTYGADIGMLQEEDGGEYWEGEIDESTREKLLALGYQIEDLD